MTYAIDSTELYDALAAAMNAQPDLYEDLGWCDLDLGVVVQRPDDDDFRVHLRFRGYRCEAVLPFEEGADDDVDCRLEGPLDAWEAMLANILAEGRATGRLTISSLVLLGDQIKVKGADPMGVDRFFRFNQTLQSYFDAAADLAQPVA